MALRAPVYAGNITNLSDARYFAGMGVQWLGFQIDPNQTSYLNPQKFREIVGWVTGPALVLEPQPNISTNDLTQLAGDYGIDLLRLLPQAAYAGPCGYYLDSPMTSPSVQSSAFIILDPGTTEPVEIFYDLIESCFQATPIFVRAKSISNAQQLLDRFPSIGFYVSGSQEVKPGIADYDYRELLEYLDAD